MSERQTGTSKQTYTDGVLEKQADVECEKRT